MYPISSDQDQQGETVTVATVVPVVCIVTVVSLILVVGVISLIVQKTQSNSLRYDYYRSGCFV